MVYVDPKNLNYDPYWQKWVNSRPTKPEQDLMNGFYKKYAVPCIDYVRNYSQHKLYVYSSIVFLISDIIKLSSRLISQYNKDTRLKAEAF